MSDLLVRFVTRFPMSTIIDAGALYGYFGALAMAASKGRAKVYAFEMNPDSFVELSEVAAANPGIYPIHAALGAIDAPSQPIAFDGFTLKADSPAEGAEQARVDFLTITKFARDTDIRIDLMKLDVEGYEGLVMEGAADQLLSNRSVVLMELHATKLLTPHGTTRVDLLQKLIGQGFRAYFFGHQRRDVRGIVEMSVDFLEERRAAYEAANDSLVVLSVDDIRKRWPGLTVTS